MTRTNIILTEKSKLHKAKYSMVHLYKGLKYRKNSMKRLIYTYVVKVLKCIQIYLILNQDSDYLEGSRVEDLGCARYLTYRNFMYNLCGRYHLVYFTKEETAAQESELVRTAVPLNFDFGFPG